jgi:hypothetical protein
MLLIYKYYAACRLLEEARAEVQEAREQLNAVPPGK